MHSGTRANKVLQHLYVLLRQRFLNHASPTRSAIETQRSEAGRRSSAPLQMLESRMLYSGSPGIDPSAGDTDPAGSGPVIDVPMAVQEFTDPATGDLDRDYDIDDADLGTAFANYTGAVGNVGKTEAQGDTDGDGDIDDADLGTLFASYTGAMLPVELVSGQTVQGTISPVTEFDQYRIDAEAGEKLFVSVLDAVSSTSAFDLGIFITNPDGTLLAEADDRSAGASFSDLRLEQTGTYSIWIRDLGFNFSGNYSLTTVVIDDVVDADNTVLTSGLTVGASLGIGDIDTFTIEGEAGETLFLNLLDAVTSTSAFDLGVFIFNPDGTLLSSLDDLSAGASFSSLAMDQTGTYTILLRDLAGDATGNYSLTAVVIDSAVDADNTALISGLTVSGSLGSGDIDTFTIDGEAGETLFLNFLDAVTSTSAFDPGVFIFNPDGTLLSSLDDLSAGASFSSLAMDQTGTYTILLRDLAGDATGNYSLTAVVIDSAVDADNTALTSGLTVSGNLGSGDIDTFTIGGEAGETLFLNFLDAVTSTSAFDPGVFIFNPDGTLLENFDDLSAGASFSGYRLDQDGNYTVLIRDLFGNATGGYTLTAVVVDETVDVDNTVLASGVTANGNLGQGDIDTFTIAATAGDSLTIQLTDAVTSTSAFDPGFFIFNPDGTELRRVNGASSGATLSNIPLDQSGTYTVVLRDQFSNSSGNYSLTATIIGGGSVAGPAPDSAVALTSGNTVNGVLEATAIDTYTIQADAGEILFLSFQDGTTSSSFNPNLTIFNPDVTTRAAAFADSNGIEFAFTGLYLTQSGTYTVQIEDDGKNQTAGYSLTAVVVDETVDGDNVVLSSGTTFNGILENGDIDTFTFTGEVGEELYLNFVDSTSSSSFNPDLYLFNPDGTLRHLEFGSTSGHALSGLKLTQDGDYTLLIRDVDANASTAYTLTTVIVDEVVDNDTTALTSGQTFNGVLDTGDIDTFTIDAEAGERLFLSFLDSLGGSTFNPEIAIYNPDGTRLVANPGSSTGIEFSDLRLVQTGTYTVVLQDPDANGSGGYALTAVVIDETIDSDNTTLTSGVTAVNVLDPGDIDTFTIAANSGQTLNVAFEDLIGGSTFNAGVFVYNPDGTLRARNLGSASAFELADLDLKQTGLYTIVVRDLGADGSAGYNLTASLVA